MMIVLVPWWLWLAALPLLLALRLARLLTRVAAAALRAGWSLTITGVSAWRNHRRA